MKHGRDSKKRPARVAEPVQVYLDPPDRERLDRLSAHLGTTKSDVLRRGLEALEAQTAAAAGRRGDRVSLPTFAGGRLLPGVDLDDTAALIELMEGEDPPAAG